VDLEELSSEFRAHLLLESLDILIDGRNSEKDTSTRADSTKHISSDGKGTNAETTKGSSGGDVTLKIRKHGTATMTRDHHLLVLDLTDDIARSTAADLNPSLAEDGARAKDESDVDDGVDGVMENVGEGRWGRQVVGNTTDGDGLTLARSGVACPGTEQTDEHVGGEATIEHLRDEIDVADESALEDDGDVAGVEETDGIRAGSATDLLRAERDVHTEALEVNNDEEHDHSSDEVRHVGQVGAEESFTKSTDLVVASDEQLEESDDSTLKLCATAHVESHGAKSTPDDRLTDVGGDEDGDTTAKTIALLKKLIKAKNDDASKNKLKNDQNAIHNTNLAGLTIHSTKNVGSSLADSDDQTEQLLNAIEKSLLFLVGLIDIDDLATSKKLHNKVRCHKRADTKFHQSTMVRSHDSTKPVERIRTISHVNTIKRDLTADEEDEKSNKSIDHLLLEGNLTSSLFDVRNDSDEGLTDVQKTHHDE